MSCACATCKKAAAFGQRLFCRIFLERFTFGKGEAREAAAQRSLAEAGGKTTFFREMIGRMVWNRSISTENSLEHFNFEMREDSQFICRNRCRSYLPALYFAVDKDILYISKLNCSRVRTHYQELFPYEQHVKIERFTFEKGETRGGGTAPPGPK